jgi:ferredoxin-NADP reductase
MKLRHTLIYGNKTWEDVIFQRQLEDLTRQYPDKLRIVHTLSREARETSGAGEVRNGRVSDALIREFIPDPTGVEVFACGPGVGKFERQAAKEKGEEPAPRFLETTLEALENHGVPDERIHRESYG